MTIIVSADGTTWVADFVDDPQVYDLFGTTVLATPFTAAVPIDEVLVKLRAVNPGCIVVHASA